VRSCLGRETQEKRPERRARDWETLRGSQTGLDPHHFIHILTVGRGRILFVRQGFCTAFTGC
jgi:hypothetical protein